MRRTSPPGDRRLSTWTVCESLRGTFVGSNLHSNAAWKRPGHSENGKVACNKAFRVGTKDGKPLRQKRRHQTSSGLKSEPHGVFVIGRDLVVPFENDPPDLLGAAGSGESSAQAPERSGETWGKCPEKARSRSGHALVASWSCTDSFDDHAHAVALRVSSPGAS